jgi:hypothetical protein
VWVSTLGDSPLTFYAGVRLNKARQRNALDSAPFYLSAVFPSPDHPSSGHKGWWHQTAECPKGSLATSS